MYKHISAFFILNIAFSTDKTKKCISPICIEELSKNINTQFSYLRRIVIKKLYDQCNKKTRKKNSCIQHKL